MTRPRPPPCIGEGLVWVMVYKHQKDGTFLFSLSFFSPLLSHAYKVGQSGTR